MPTHVGVWIDHKKAVIVAAGEDVVTVVPSEVPVHTRFTGSGGYPGSQNSQRGGSEHRSEERNFEDLGRAIAARAHELFERRGGQIVRAIDDTSGADPALTPSAAACSANQRRSSP